MLTSIEQIKAAKTGELVAFVNAHSGKEPIKKFATRYKAEERAIAVLEALPTVTLQSKKVSGKAPAVLDAASVGPEPVGPGLAACPRCGSEELYEGEVIKGIVKNEDKVGGCHHCDFHWDLRLLPKQRAGNAAGVAVSWTDPKVMAARLTRNGVTVTFEGKTHEHKSVRDAFRHYRLPDSAHIRFRMRLKASGKEAFEHSGKLYMFKLVD